MRHDVVALAVAAAVAATCRVCVAAPARTAVVLEAKDEGSMNVGGVRATIDGAQVVDKLDGTAILLSPGAHRAVFAAPGFRSVENTFVVVEGQKLRVVVFLTAATRVLTLPAPGRPDEPSIVWSRRQTLGVVLAGVGLGSLAVGTVWSLKSKSTYDDALSFECRGDPSRCSEQGIADGKAAHREATIATIGFAAAGVLLAAGATLYFTGRKQTALALAPAVDGGASMMMAGAW
ncbi:MAG TPA: hypothetical protein VFH68_20110 [Polyangia bacterium]|nr:hypothetical protein [Polyangia bacterium]